MNEEKDIKNIKNDYMIVNEENSLIVILVSENFLKVNIKWLQSTVCN